MVSFEPLSIIISIINKLHQRVNNNDVLRRLTQNFVDATDDNANATADALDRTKAPPERFSGELKLLGKG